jgi:hypothetical protein
MAFWLEFWDGSVWQTIATQSYVNSYTFNINTNTTGSLNINRLSGYPANAALYLNGNGGWSDPLQLTVNSTGYNININNLNTAATYTGLSVQSNGIETTQFGYNASTDTSYVWSNNSLLFYTNSTAQMQLLSNGVLNLFANNLQTTGNISAQTGTLMANNLAAYNSGVIVCANALSIQDTGTYKPYNGGYGYLNSSGSVGTASGQNPYSINCNNRVKASEFNAVSSIKIKNILAQGETIEPEAVSLFKQIPFSKYEYKDKIKEGPAITYGIVAEELAQIIPEYVNHQDEGWIPNIFMSGKTEVKGTNLFKIKFNTNRVKCGSIQSNRLKIIFDDQAVEAIIEKLEPKSLLVQCTKPLPQKVFVYGTFEQCPSVAKNKLFELSMVVLKNALKRIEVIEQKLEKVYNL